MRVTFPSFVCLHAALVIAFMAAPTAAQISAPSDGAVTQAAHGSILERVEVQAATLSLRYKVNENSRRARTANLQESALLKVRVNADRGRRYSITAGAATGSSFTCSRLPRCWWAQR